MLFNPFSLNLSNGASNSRSRTSTTSLLYTSKYAPNFEVTLTKDEILKVVENKNVTDVFERTTGCIENNIVSFNSSNVSRTLSYDVENDMSWYFDVTGITKLRDEYGLDGTGVKVGTIEGYVPDTSVPCFANSDITNRPSDVKNWLSAPNGHMNYTTSIMAALTSEYTGGIPNAKFYAASTNNNLQGAGEMKGAFEWVISQGVSVITSSVSLGHDNENEYGDYAKWLDHVTNQHNVLFVMAGPHANSNMGSGGMSYNAVVVGSSDDDQETVTSGWLNGTTDPYKPDIIAPGDMIRTPIGTGGATSAAAPIVACAAAQLIQKYPLLKTNPMMTKALLLNGTKYLGQENEMNPSTQTTGFTREGGAGILNVENSMLPMVTTESILYSLNNGNDTYNDSAYVSSADINNNKQLRITVCSTKNNLVSGIHTSGNLENNPITAFNITVKKRGNNDYWRSYNYYDNKTAVCFTPPSRGYYDITVTRITNFDNDSSFYLAISRHN